MPVLRTSRLLISLVLAWFALFLVAAIASAAINPASLQSVCTSGGLMKLVDLGDDESGAKVSTSMDCPLCATVGTPPSHSTFAFAKPTSLAHALQPSAAAHIASSTRVPPSRAPPALI